MKKSCTQTRLKTVELKRQIELSCIFALPLDAKKACLKICRNKPLFFLSLFQGVGVHCIVLPLLCNAPIFGSLLISCFVFHASELLQSFPFCIFQQLSGKKKKKKPPQTFCKLTLLSLTDADAYPDGNSGLFALFKPTPLHT